MARKKSSKQKPLTPKEFTSSPFKSLKGLSAFPLQGGNAGDQADQKEVAPAPAPDAESSFADEMDFLGVQPLSGRQVETSPRRQDKAVVAPDAPSLSREERDRKVFLEALGGLEKTFVDEWPDEEVKQAVPRRMKQVERGQLKPDAELDLHGMTIDEASAKALYFLQDSIYQGWRTVLIVTGKGLHSSDGPVLRQAIERLLGEQRELVVEWGIAPRRYGGSGAVVVFLRQGPVG